jgi:ABC-type branched-subunit amino acid transport system substrate-binding protein
MIFSLTACSNKGDGTKKDVSAPEVQDYNIAVCIPITGTNATYAAYIKNGLEMALANLEKRGGLNGTGGKIILDFYDDCNDPKQGVALAERIVEDDKYLCEIGSFASPVFASCCSDLQRSRDGSVRANLFQYPVPSDR